MMLKHTGTSGISCKQKTVRDQPLTSVRKVRQTTKLTPAEWIRPSYRLVVFHPGKVFDLFMIEPNDWCLKYARPWRSAHARSSACASVGG